MAEKDDDGLRDIHWLAEYLDVPERTIYSWRASGSGPPVYKVGRQLRYRPSEVREWLASHSTAAAYTEIVGLPHVTDREP